jgi:SAM-dependent methyltransferase
MNDSQDHVAEHYAIDGLKERVLDAFKREYGSLDNLSVEDIAGADSFHIRGRPATIELADRVGFQSDWQVLDVGSGPGGTARYLTSTYGCHVTGLDLTPSFVALATELSKLVGLDDSTDYECGNALAMPFEDNTFNCVWIEHVQMNIEDKQQLAHELHRVVKPGGKLALYEIFNADGDPVQYPTPWSDTGDTSYLVTADEMRSTLTGTGFHVDEWHDLTQPSADWFRTMRAKAADGSPPNLGIHLVMDAMAPEKLANMFGNLNEGRLTIIQSVMSIAGDRV